MNLYVSLSGIHANHREFSSIPGERSLFPSIHLWNVELFSWSDMFNELHLFISNFVQREETDYA